MAVLQSTYATGYASGYAGMVANGETSNRISRTIEDAAGVGFGRAVFRGTGDHGCTATPSATEGNQLGITIADPSVTPVPGGAAADVYAQYDSVGIMTQGAIWVVAGEAVTDGAQVYIEAVTFDFVDTATSNTILTGWFFQDTAADGALVRIARR